MEGKALLGKEPAFARKRTQGDEFNCTAASRAPTRELSACKLLGCTQKGVFMKKRPIGVLFLSTHTLLG
jgi:hypothetical protein